MLAQEWSICWPDKCNNFLLDTNLVPRAVRHPAIMNNFGDLFVIDDGKRDFREKYVKKCPCLHAICYTFCVRLCNTAPDRLITSDVDEDFVFVVWECSLDFDVLIVDNLEPFFIFVGQEVFDDVKIRDLSFSRTPIVLDEGLVLIGSGPVHRARGNTLAIRVRASVPGALLRPACIIQEGLARYYAVPRQGLERMMRDYLNR
jgi:hypothetical protein